MTLPLWVAAAVVAAEYLLFSIAFDSGALRRRDDLWALAGYSGSLAVFVATAFMGVVLVVQTNERRPRPVVLARRIDIYGLAALAGHAACLGLLWWLTSRVLSASGPPAGPAEGWLALWFVVAVATPLLAGAATLPSITAQSALAANWPALVAGALIGGGAWLASQGSTLLWQPLGPWTLRAVERSLRLVLGDPYYDPAISVIGSQQFQVVMDRSCSGFEGVGLMTVFVVAYLVMARRELRFPQAFLLLPLGIGASLAANVVRIVALILVGTLISPDLAAGGFHARAGWVFFSALAVALVLISRTSQFFAHEVTESRFGHPTAAYLMPFLTLVAVGLVTGLASEHLDLLYGVRLVAALLALKTFRHYYRDISPSWSWNTVAVGLIAAAVFIALTPRPEAESIRLWREEWLALPDWARVAWTLLRALGSILVVPLAEELAFRGYLLRRLTAVEFETVPPARASLVALLISSAAFGAIHHGWLAGAVAGLLFGIVQMRGNSIMNAIVAHAVSNAAVALYVIAFGQWWLWM
jgi:exosortase E/protease (VPEID-CTERM system)